MEFDFIKWQFITIHIIEQSDHYIIILSDFNYSYELFIINILNYFSSQTGINVGEQFKKETADLSKLKKDLKYRFHRHGFEVYFTEEQAFPKANPSLITGTTV
jgi:hypothetical protein